MKITYGITYSLDLRWVNEFMGEIEFEYDGNKYIYYDYNFYYTDEVNDDQDSEWKIVQDLELKYILEEPLLRNEDVTNEFYKYIETELTRKLAENYIIDLIEEL